MIIYISSCHRAYTVLSKNDVIIRLTFYNIRTQLELSFLIVDKMTEMDGSLDVWEGEREGETNQSRSHLSSHGEDALLCDVAWGLPACVLPRNSTVSLHSHYH